MNSLAPQDATRYWLSRRTVNDLFLLYCFSDTGQPAARLRADILERAARIPDLCVRLRERRFAYPEWVPCAISADQITDHTPLDSSWPNVVAALKDLLPHGVRAEVHPWRLHLFRDVRDAPGADGPALIAVLQISHALADGRRAAEIARALWSESSEPRGDTSAGPAIPDIRAGGWFRGVTELFRRLGSAARPMVPDMVARKMSRRFTAARRAGDTAWRRVPSYTVIRGAVAMVSAEVGALLGFPIALSRTVIRGFAAERTRRAIADLTDRGEIPAPATDFPLTRLNHPPAPDSHEIRMIVRDDLRVPGRTVTVVAATAIAAALSRYLSEHGEPDIALAAQISMARPAEDAVAQPKRFARWRRARPRNNYVDLGVGLAADEPDPRRRADRIAATLAARRARATHPLVSAGNGVTEVIPAPVLRRDIAGYPLDRTPEALSGHTVISSVHRGPADLSLGGGRVRWTAGFPALGTVMHLTHGIHGLGDTVTVSIHADPAVVPDIDAYAELLDVALTESITALRA